MVLRALLLDGEFHKVKYDVLAYLAVHIKTCAGLCRKDSKMVSSAGVRCALLYDVPRLWHGQDAAGAAVGLSIGTYRYQYGNCSVAIGTRTVTTSAVITIGSSCELSCVTSTSFAGPSVRNMAACVGSTVGEQLHRIVEEPHRPVICASQRSARGGAPLLSSSDRR